MSDCDEPKKRRKNSDPAYRRAVQSGKNVKGDKKNVVKNFVKSFRGFLCTWGEEAILMRLMGLVDKKKLDRARSEWIEFERNSKYNNRLVKQLLHDSKFAAPFIYFLQNIAAEWLKQSGVVDKKSHQEVLRGYIKASLDQSELEKIVCLKSRCNNGIEN